MTKSEGYSAIYFLTYSSAIKRASVEAPAGLELAIVRWRGYKSVPE